MKATFRAACLPLLFTALGGPPHAPLRAAEPTGKQKAQVAAVAAKLLARMKPVAGLRWPPEIEAVSDEEAQIQDNAYAGAYKVGGKDQPYVHITGLYLKRMAGDEQGLALTLAHELGHIHHKHFLKRARGGEVVKLAVSRDREYQADAFGARLMKEAGFSVIHAVRMKSRLMRDKTLHDAPLDALRSTHPSWDDRFGRVSADPGVWDALATFGNGVALLTSEQYFAAERCFEQVTKYDPKCYEAWVNLGHARLMRYCDMLDPADLRSMGAGQIVCGGFYRRAKSLEPPVRGPDATLWKSAVGALRRAIKLKRVLPLARFNLALADLVHPDGPEFATAAGRLEQTLKEVAADRTIDPLDRIALHVNLGVALLNGEKIAAAEAQFGKARKLLASLKVADKESLPVALALRYNEATVLAKGKGGKAKALGLFESYLRDGEEQSAWWLLAYDRYAELCKGQKREPKSRKELRRGVVLFRPHLELRLGDKAAVALGEKTEDVLKRLGGHTAVKVYGDSLKRYRFEKYGVEVLENNRRVIAVFLLSKKSPALRLVPSGPGGAGKAVEVRIGQSRKDLNERVPATRSAVGRNLLDRGDDEQYHYYRSLGLAVKFDADYPDGRVSEIVLVQIP